jgi:hypothetical protein
MKKMLFFLSSSLLLLASCQKHSEGGGVYEGPKQNFQGGKAWTVLQTDKDGHPSKLAITIDAAALATLDPGAGESHEGDELSLKFHPKASAITPFTHALLEWNPHGHEPAGIYDKPHFDFHFYIQSEADRRAIPPYELDSSKFLNYPPAAYLPATYFTVPGGVPEMGTHWVDATSPELNGQLFTQTFLYGTYDGKVTFYEPMITKAFIDANTSFQRSIPQPAKYQQSGYYPTTIELRKESGVLTVALEGFVYRTAS